MSDEGKRWYGCQGCGRIGTSPRDLLRQGCEGKPELLVLATELDRLEAELTKVQRYEHRTAKRAEAAEDAAANRQDAMEAAEARVRELEGALERIAQRVPDAAPDGDVWLWCRETAREALNAPAEGEYSYEVEDAEALAELEADEERHKDG